MRVLFTAVDAWGHVNPMVPLARAFEDRGDEVLWAVGSRACERLKKHGFAAVECGLSEVEFAKARGELLADLAGLSAAERPNVAFERIFGGLLPAPMIADLLPFAQEWRPDLVVSEPGEFSAPIVAKIVGARYVTHSWGIALPEQRMLDAGSNAGPLWEMHGLEPRPYGGKFDGLYIDLFPPSLPQRALGHINSVQPMRLDVFAGAEDSALDWLDTSSDVPLVYVTFGTIFNDAGPLGRAVEAVRDLPVRVVVTVGPSGGVAAIGPQPANVHVEQYIPQNLVLPHCSLVVSHGGSGTFLATLIAGLPQLCLPQGADQFQNAEACVGAGAGLALTPSEATVETIRAAASRLLAEDRFRESAATVSRDIATMPSPAEVAELLASS